MVGRAQLLQNRIPYLPGGQPTNWKIIIPEKFSLRIESPEPLTRLPSLGVWQREEEPPENLALKGHGVWLQEFHSTGGNRSSTLGGHTQGPRHTRTHRKKQWHHTTLGQTYLLVLEGLLLRWGAAVAHGGNKDTGRDNSREYSLAWALLEAAISSPRPNLTQQPVSPSAGTPQAKQWRRRKHSHTHQQTGCLTSSWAWPCPPEGQNPVQPTSGQEQDLSTRKPA